MNSIKAIFRLQLLLLFISLTAGPLRADDPTIQGGPPTDAEPVLQTAEPVGLADWPLLFRALNRKTTSPGRIISFRELWDADPDTLTQPIELQGLVIRRFRREPVGQFPALDELWIRTDDDGLILVTTKADRSEPQAAEQDITKPGSPVQIHAYFLRKVQYEAADTQRIAPWLAAYGIYSSNTGSEFLAENKNQGNANTWMLVVWATLASAVCMRLLLVFLQRKSGTVNTRNKFPFQFRLR
jgi:hypothetical protein